MKTKYTVPTTEEIPKEITETEKIVVKTVTFVFCLTYSDGKEVYSAGEYYILPEEKALFFKSLGFGDISVSN